MPTDVAAKKLFTVDEFQRMHEAGILLEDCRYELIRGEVIEMPPADSPHIGGVNRLTWLFITRIGQAATVSPQNAVRLDRYSQPLPDLAVLRYRSDFYAGVVPQTKDVLLLVEVADLSLKRDRTIKAELYAESGIPEYWVLDIQGDVVLAHSNPKDQRYSQITVCRRGMSLIPAQLPQIAFTVDELLGDEGSHKKRA